MYSFFPITPTLHAYSNLHGYWFCNFCTPSTFIPTSTVIREMRYMSYCGLFSWCKNKCFWKKFTCTYLFNRVVHLNLIISLSVVRWYDKHPRPGTTCLRLLGFSWITKSWFFHSKISFLIHIIKKNQTKNWLWIFVKFLTNQNKCTSHPLSRSWH